MPIPKPHRRSLRSIGLLAALLVRAALADPPSLRPIESKDAVLVVAPHPDDESLCCAGMLRHAAAAGARTAVVWLTSGDAFELDAMVVERTLEPHSSVLQHLAERRMREAVAAVEGVGVPARNRIFLGYPDRGLLELLVDYYASPYRSPYTGAARVPYVDAYSPAASYTGKNLERDFGTILDAFRPTLVFAPSPLDAHSDHRAAGSLVIRAMSTRGQLDRVRFWIVHGGPGWPGFRGLQPALPASPPPRGTKLPWLVLRLDEQEIEAKLAAISAHRSQMDVMSSFMLSFVRSTELYSMTGVP